ncbi:CU044_5270 family protein [Streptomyces justiciae]|uniref:CU044_5270 family protein n=1 Tax=Streptomyces justiciae TaxID=2780140 RepID=A0ABU3M8J8_9ACTN|nr:CU044_5270 family protein [Streptomyces justiciae]MDT7847845.1 CU044_5270 family protein [Streptomyces justiciae]
MADELDLLRRANPVPVDGPHFGDGPLDHHAERQLDRLLGQRTSRRPRLYWGLAATGVVAALVSALLFTGQTTAPAIAAPRPLVVRADSTPVPLETLAERARAADGSAELRKGTHVRTWSLGMSDDKPPITYPEERIVRWNADDSHTETVDDGHDRTTRTYPPSWSDAPPQSPPPHDVARLRAYLQEAAYSKTPLDTGELLDAVDYVLDTWQLGARESAALAQLLADADGLKPVGQVTDRLGRRGQAYVYEQSATRKMLIMDPATGAVLGLEATFTKAEPEYGVKAGDVMDYSAWTR